VFPGGDVRCRTVPKMKSGVEVVVAVLDCRRANRFESRRARFLEALNPGTGF
jgi:hypothetical protein